MLFGHGLVGQAVSNSLAARTGARAVYVAYNWEDRTQRTQALRKLFERLDTSVPLRIVWTAGRAGFGSTTAEMAVETALLEELLSSTCAYAKHHHDIAIQFASSAGGLFEGRTDVGAQTEPAPHRPYGLAKLYQEEAVATAAKAGHFACRIYRLSSVYGCAPKSRVGLISALIMNGLTGQTTHITGDVGTLRDYVYAQDVGDYFLKQLYQVMDTPSSPVLLASGVSVSIAHIIALIESRLQQSIKIEYQRVPTNNADMSFAQDTLPADWTPTPLEKGIDRVIEEHKRALLER